MGFIERHSSHCSQQLGLQSDTEAAARIAKIIRVTLHQEAKLTISVLSQTDCTLYSNVQFLQRSRSQRVSCRLIDVDSNLTEWSHAGLLTRRYVNKAEPLLSFVSCLSTQYINALQLTWLLSLPIRSFLEGTFQTRSLTAQLPKSSNWGVRNPRNNIFSFA